MNKLVWIVCTVVIAVSFVTMVVGVTFIAASMNGRGVREPIAVTTTKSNGEAEKGAEQQKKADAQTLQKYVNTVSENMSKVSGECQWGFRDFSADLAYSTKSSPVPSASVIKIFIMEYAYSLVQKGELSLSDEISGSTVEGLLHAMITRSDNAATNILIERFGMDSLNGYFAEMGYDDTRIQRKMLDTQAQREGRDNFTSVGDVMLFLEKLYENKEKEPYSKMLETMKQQQVRTKIPKKFPVGTVIANKTGELSNVENDVGIIFGPKTDLAVVFLCSSLADSYSARSAISDAAYALYLEANGLD